MLTKLCAAPHAMSAWGQKRTYAVQNGTSALPPIVTAKADIYNAMPNSTKGAQWLTAE